ncbi:RNA polymerase sigma factor [Sphingobacterium detergens]|uniref:RNA polymerase sigma-70 factor (ECF subfamily) n=1 Tax=Sphingobacterium detergens TaxID=1145106 RepID=A0A420BFB8_SPHD1|nr:RNA polymerase sigma-70 factor [Sphingobacterium detergens]RKE55411.1 RNA polymerase sigma-70 factor (ECF subfamily) [Sphingobacterium detergens]
MMLASNSELISKMSVDEREGFSDVYEQYWEDILRYVMRIIPDESEACDIVQESFLALWEVRKDIPKLRSIKAYLYIISRNLAFKHLRLRLDNQEAINSYVDRYTEKFHSIDKVLESKELNSLLEAEISRLPEKMREVFLLSRKQHLTYQQIAEKLNISDKTVKKQIYKALKHLRLKVDEEYIPYLILFLIFDCCN